MRKCALSVREAVENALLINLRISIRGDVTFKKPLPHLRRPQHGDVPTTGDITKNKCIGSVVALYI